VGHNVPAITPSFDTCDFVPLPERGRRYQRTRPVRLGDSSPGGRLRFDGLARYLQDVSNDDTRDAAFEDDMAWVVRRTAIEVRSGARFGEELTLTTFASGVGRSWAERRVTVTGSHGASIEAASLWVHVTDEGRPKALPDEFFAIYGEAIGERKVSARLTHGEPRGDAQVHDWPLRFTDFDVLEHMNNAAYWSAVEEELSRRRDLRPPMRAEMEFRVAIEPGASVRIHSCDTDDTCEMWMVVGPTVHASAVVTRA
jgi:acyl-ACP thioesterase